MQFITIPNCSTIYHWPTDWLDTHILGLLQIVNPLKFLSVSTYHWYLNSIYPSAFWFTPAAWLTCEGSWAGHTWVATYNCRIRQDRWQWYFSSEWVSDEVERCFFFPQTSRSTYKLCNHICKTRSNAIEAIMIHDVVVAWKCCITGPLWGESIGHWWFPSQRAQ